MRGRGFIAIALLAGCPERAPEPIAAIDAAVPDAAIDAAALLSWTPPQMLSELMPFGFDGDYDDPSVTADLRELYFGARPRSGSPATDDEDIWVARRDGPEDPWSSIDRVDELSTDADETGASVSLDGKTIVFGRVVAGQSFDLFIASREDRDQPWGEPAPIAELNTARSEAPGQLGLDGLTLYFASNRRGDFDVFAASRPSLTEPFAPPSAIAVAAVTGRDELSPTISADDNELTFAAADEPPFLELYVSRRAAQEPFTTAEPIAELNSPLSESDLRLGASGRLAVMASDRTVLGRNRIWTTSR